MAASSGQGSQDPARVDPIWQMGAAPRTGPGAPRSSGVRREPLQLCGHVKNTFIHVSPADCEGGFTFPLRRQVSAPASTSTSNSESSSTLDRSSSTLGGLPTGGDPAERVPGERVPAKQEQALADSGDEAAEGEEDPQGEGGASRRRRNVRRPCKNQRDRYRKLKGYLEEEVRRDPHGFDFKKCYLPPSISANEPLCARLAAGLEEYRNELISEGAVPLACDASPSMEPPSLPAPGPAMGSRSAASSSAAPFEGTSLPLHPVPNGQQLSRANIISL